MPAEPRHPQAFPTLPEEVHTRLREIHGLDIEESFRGFLATLVRDVDRVILEAAQESPMPFAGVCGSTVELPPHETGCGCRGCGLTDSELAVLEAAANGLSASATGARLGHSEPMVKWRRKQIARKLLARNLAHAVAIYWRAAEAA
jgi:DNA-binding CsgD family transcriptional regulator